MQKLLASALIVVSSLTHAQEWRDAGHYKDVTLYTRLQQKGAAKQFRGTVEIAASMKAVLAFILVRETMPTWFYNIREASTLPTNNPDASLAYFWIRGVWPTSDRDAVVHVTVQQNPSTLEVTVQAESTDPSLVQVYDERVRMPLMASAFKVLPLGPGRTQVLFEGIANPGGSVPSSLVNAFVLDTPKYTLEALKSRAEHLQDADLVALNTNHFATLALEKIKLP